jgi:hypothetical protein
VTALYHIVQRKGCKSAKLRCAEFHFDAIPLHHDANTGRPGGHRRLSSTTLFPIMALKKRLHSMPGVPAE